MERSQHFSKRSTTKGGYLGCDLCEGVSSRKNWNTESEQRSRERTEQCRKLIFNNINLVWSHEAAIIRVITQPRPFLGFSKLFLAPPSISWRWRHTTFHTVNTAAFLFTLLKVMRIACNEVRGSLLSDI